jgi:hypothetical protein
VHEVYRARSREYSISRLMLELFLESKFHEKRIVNGTSQMYDLTFALKNFIVEQIINHSIKL